MLMIRGTTAQFQFKLPYSKTEVQSAEAVFWQSNNDGLEDDYPLPIKKGYKLQMSANGSIVTSGPWNWIDDYTLAVKLWQQETLTFTDKYKAKVQLRARSTDGLVFASLPETIVVYPIYGDYPMGDDIIPTPDGDDLIILDGDDIV
jgi:hypothetical protein